MFRTVSKLQFLLLFFCISVTCSFAQPMSSSRRSMLKSAKEHMQYEEYEQAIPILTDLLQLEPESPYYNYWMGKSLYQTYKRNQAVKYLDIANDLNPAVDKEFHRFYALALHYNLRFDEAIAQYKLDAQRFENASPEHLWVTNRISQCVYAKELVKKKEGKKVKINNMGPDINTPYAEHSPVISANDSILVFTARRPDCIGARPDEEFYDEDVYYARKTGNAGENGQENDTWTSAKNIGSPVNEKGHDATIALTADGKRLYIYRHKQGGGLFVTDFDAEGNKWKDPQKMPKPFNSKHYEACIWQSADRNRMFFSSDRPGGYGGRDIYVSYRKGKNSWSDPENLGPTVNTPFDEDAPYLHPDGKTLYYSSNGPNSMGGFDIFVTEFDSTNENWLEPLNMGYPVNTSDEDIYFVISESGQHGYYSSGKEGGYGEKDIYRIDFPYFPYPRRNNIIEISGIIQDETTLDTLPAWVLLIDKSTNEVVDSFYTGAEADSYYFELNENKDYSLKVNVEGYDQINDYFNTPSLNGKDIALEKNYMLVKPILQEQKTTIEIMNVYFDFDEYGLRRQSKIELDRAIKILRENPDLSIELRGHTDWYGTYDYNLRLSQNRSRAVQKYLLANEIDPSRLMLSYYSENDPLETNNNDEGRQYNRRTELIFYKDGEVSLSSQKLRTGVTSVYVDHTRPKGAPGYDKPGSQQNIANSGGMTASDTPKQGQKLERKFTIAARPGGYTSTTKTTTSPSVGATTSADDSPGSTEHEVEGANYGNPSTASLAATANSNESIGSTEAEYAVTDVFEGITLRHIYFDFDKHGLRQESIEELKKVQDLLEEDLRLTLEIHGHTDAFGSIPYNQKLSENRCVSAHQFLLKQGIDATQLTTSGYSELDPMDTNESANGRQNNRRVEFRFYIDDKLVYQSVP